MVKAATLHRAFKKLLAHPEIQEVLRHQAGEEAIVSRVIEQVLAESLGGQAATQARAQRELLQKINLNAAGLDIGAEETWVCVPEGRDERSVRMFKTFTPDLYELADWLEKCGVETAAMESKDKTEYVDRGAAYYEDKYHKQVVKNLKRKAARLGFELVPAAAQDGRPIQYQIRFVPRQLLARKMVELCSESAYRSPVGALAHLSVS